MCYPLLLQSMECEYEEKIMKDLARTFPMHPLFTERGGVGQQKMFNVLKAYAVHDKALGYCQGMAFVVGILLLSEGGHLAHLQLFGHKIEAMSKATFYFVIGVLVLTEIVQSRYQKKLLQIKSVA